MTKLGGCGGVFVVLVVAVVVRGGVDEGGIW